MRDPVLVSLPAPELPAESAGPEGDAAGQRMRAIDTLLADRGELFQALFLGAPIAKAMVELDGHVLVANPMMCALTGRTAESLAGRHVDLLAHPDDPPIGDLGLAPVAGDPVMDPNLMLDGERRLRRSDGTELWVVQSHEVVRRNDGEPQFVVLSMVDVTDRRRRVPGRRRGRRGPRRAARAGRPAARRARRALRRPRAGDQPLGQRRTHP